MQNQDHVSEETVKKTSELAKLELTAEEASAAQKALAGILRHAAILSELPLQPAAQDNFSDHLRRDVAANSLSLEEVLSNTPCHDNEYFIVPKTVE